MTTRNPLLQIPGIGKVIAHDLMEMGFTKPEDLKGKDPEIIYEMTNKLRGSIQDPCLLYTFRCAVYFADAPPEKRDPELLKWWNWKDREYKTSK